MLYRLSYRPDRNSLLRLGVPSFRGSFRGHSEAAGASPDTGGRAALPQGPVTPMTGD